MTPDFKPMLASPMEDNLVQWPLAASPKLDGIRAIVRDGKVFGRSNKLLPNHEIQAVLGQPWFNGLDGELIVGSPTDRMVYRNSTSGVMRTAGIPDWKFFVFDSIKHMTTPWAARAEVAQSIINKAKHPRVKWVEHEVLHGPEQLAVYEEARLREGYEGVMLRKMTGFYKRGRSTAKESLLLKVKRFSDSEAVVLEVIEELKNENEATTNELGHTKRSSHKANKSGKGRMGALRVKDLKSGHVFEVGTGFTAADKKWWWDDLRIGLVIKYKYFDVGGYDLPRHPVYLGLREAVDL